VPPAATLDARPGPRIGDGTDDPARSAAIPTHRPSSRRRRARLTSVAPAFDIADAAREINLRYDQPSHPDRSNVMYAFNERPCLVDLVPTVDDHQSAGPPPAWRS
jgi:hypothetical protein